MARRKKGEASGSDPISFKNRGFSFKDLIRYVANNCDSEQMLEKFTENSVVRNLCEYLNVYLPHNCKDFDTEIPIEQWKETKKGSPKELDVGIYHKSGQMQVCIEVKYAKADTGFIPRILSDVVRIGKLTENTKNGTRRCIMIVGQRKAFIHLFEENKLRRVLPLPGRMDRWLPGIQSQKHHINPKKLPERLQKELERLGQTKKFHVTLLGLFQPNNSGYTLPEEDEADYLSYMDAGIWEIHKIKE